MTCNCAARMEVDALMADMNEAEAAVLLRIAGRLAAGRREYGPLDPHNGKDWREEMRQEIYDWMVYDAIEGAKPDEAPGVRVWVEWES